MIYEVMIQMISVGVDDKSAAIFGSETLTTDESKTRHKSRQSQV